MEGQGEIGAEDQVIHPRVWMLQDSTCPNLNRNYGVWYPATPPLNRCWGRVGPGDSFGRMMGDQAPSYVTKIGLVNVSVAGCNIFIYKKGCPNGLDEISQGIPFDCGYTWLLDLAKKAQQSGVIKGILFHQGETNNTDPNWKYTVKQIVSDLKTDLGLGDIPFLAGELLYADYNSCCSAHNIEINKLPGIIPNAHVISAKGLPGADYAHFTTASYRTFGERYARKMLELLYHVCDSDHLEFSYSVNGNTSSSSTDILVQTGATLVLSPGPSNLLGTWSWSGAASGTTRQQTLVFDTEGSYTANVRYTNECGTVSQLNLHITVCNPSIIEAGYRMNGGNWISATQVPALRGSVLQLKSETADTTGYFSWYGAGTSGADSIQTVNTSIIGQYVAVAAYTNGCGAQSKTIFQINVCDSTRVDPKYRIDGGSLIKSDSVYVAQNANLLLSPAPSTVGTWNWSGVLTSGSAREQTISTAHTGTYYAFAIYTNPCGIISRMKMKIVIVPATGMQENRWSEKLEVFPNPVENGLFTIKGIDNLIKIDVLDMHGRTIASYDRLSQPPFRIHLETEPGTYILRFTDGMNMGYRKLAVY